MPSRIDPAAATNAFARQVQLGANVRANDQAEQMNAFNLARMQREDEAAKQPQYDPQAFQRVGGIAAQIASLGDPVQKRQAFKAAILGNGPAFDALGMPHTEALAKIDTLDDAGLEATLAALAKHAPRAAPMSVASGTSLVSQREDGTYGADFTAPSNAPGASDPYGKIDVKDYTADSVRIFEASGKRSDLVPRPPTAAAPNPNDAFNHAATLRDDFRTESVDFVSQADGYQRMVDSASDPSGAGDVALLYNYLKVLDPRSTVRDSEFQTVGSSGGLPTQVQGFFNKMVNGKLPDQLRADVVARGTKLYKGAEARYKTGVLDRFQGLARRYNVNPDEFRDPRVMVSQEAAPPPAAAAPGQPVRVNSPAEAAKLPPGTLIILPDGRRKVVPGG